MTELKLIHCSPASSLDSIPTRPLKIRGEVTFSKRLQSSIAPSADTIPETLLLRLRRLDAEQLHIIMIVAAAIERGVR